MAERRGPVERRSLRRLAGVALAAALSLAGTGTALAQVGGTAGAPSVSVEKTASPSSLPEPGGTFSFAVKVTNNTASTLVISSLTDDKYGNLATRGTCTSSANTQLIAGSSYSCTFTGTFTGNARDTQISTTTAVLAVVSVVAASTPLSVSGQTTITITDVPPTVKVTNSAAPASRPAPGGDFTHTVVVTNTSAETVRITALQDSVAGNLANQGSCNTAVDTVLRPGAPYSCSFVSTFTSTVAKSLTDEVSVTVVDNDGSFAVAKSSATVTVTATATTTTQPKGTTTTSATTTTIGPGPTTSTVPGRGTTTTVPGLELLSGPSSEPGGEVRARGTGCAANSRVELLVGTSPVGAAQAGPDGSFDATVELPDLSPSRIELVALCGPRLTALVDIVVASQVEAGASNLAVFVFFVLLSLALYRRRRVILPGRPASGPEGPEQGASSTTPHTG